MKTKKMTVIASDLHFGNRGASIHDQQWFINWLYFHKDNIIKVILLGDTIEEWLGRQSWLNDPQFQRLKVLAETVDVYIIPGNYPHDNHSYLQKVKQDLHPIKITTPHVIQINNDNGSIETIYLTHGYEYDNRAWWWNFILAPLARIIPWIQQFIARSLPSEIVQTKNKDKISKSIGAIHELALLSAVENKYSIISGHTHAPDTLSRYNYYVYNLGSVGMPGLGERVAIVYEYEKNGETIKTLAFQHVPPELS